MRTLSTHSAALEPLHSPPRRFPIARIKLPVCAFAIAFLNRRWPCSRQAAQARRSPWTRSSRPWYVRRDWALRRCPTPRRSRMPSLTVPTISHNRGKRDLRTAALAACVQERVPSMAARALRALERVQATRQLAVSHGWSPSARPKSAISRISHVPSVNRSER